MAWQVPVTSTSGFTNLGTLDSLYVGPSIQIGRTSATGSNQKIIVDGTLFSSYGDCIWFDGPTANSLTVGETGLLRCLDDFSSSAVNVSSTNSRIDNDGRIYGIDSGISFFAAAGETVSTVHNSGEVRGDKVGIVHYFSTSTERLEIWNTGVISGGTRSFQDNSTGAVDKITNYGTMKGVIQLGGGSDTYNGRQGHVQGDVLGGDGEDRLYGGSEANRLSGGIGKDYLFGGAGKDTFIFDATLNKTTNVDYISAFSHSDDAFELHTGVFPGLKSGTLNSSFFKLIASATSTSSVDSNDHILYDKKHGDLYFDQDGSGKTYDRVRFAAVADNTTIDHSDFKVVVDIP
jgi:Ca2+-binding RTX toxin-like protein